MAKNKFRAVRGVISAAEWDDLDRKNFLKEMASYNPKDRLKFLNELVKESIYINQKLNKKSLGGL